jgi:hypothetical protein
MHAHDVRDYWDGRGLVLLWLSVISGPAAWALNQLIGYALVKPSCAAGTPVALLGVSAVTLGVTLGGAWVAWWCFLRLRDADIAGDRREDRSKFVAVSGVGLNLLLALLIVTAASAQFLLSPCE